MEGVPWQALEAVCRRTLLLKFRRRVPISGCSVLVGSSALRKEQQTRFRDLAISVQHPTLKQPLDIVCKDKKEFKVWSVALAYLAHHGPPRGWAAWKDRTKRSRELSMRRTMSDTIELATPDRPKSVTKASTSSALDAASSTDDEVPSSRVVITSRQLRDRIKETSDVYSWGRGGWGQLGNSMCASRVVPSLVEALLGKGVQMVSCGRDHTVAIIDSGEVLAWGCAHNGRLGTGTLKHRPSPAPVYAVDGSKEPVTLSHVACGGCHTVGCTDTGAVLTWGGNAYGQLGVGDRRERLVPIRLRSLARTVVVRCAAGDNTTALLTDDGRLFTCGCGQSGQLGHGDLRDSALPRLVQRLEHVPLIDVACGDQHMLAVSEANELYSWGWGALGQLGHGHTRSLWKPSRVRALRGAKVLCVSAGAAHSAAVVELEPHLAAVATRAGVSVDPSMDPAGGSLLTGSSPSAAAAGAGAGAGAGVGAAAASPGQGGAGAVGGSAARGSIVVGAAVPSLRARRAVFTWGDNSSGQLGVGGVVATQRRSVRNAAELLAGGRRANDVPGTSGLKVAAGTAGGVASVPLAEGDVDVGQGHLEEEEGGGDLRLATAGAGLSRAGHVSGVEADGDDEDSDSDSEAEEEGAAVVGDGDAQAMGVRAHDVPEDLALLRGEGPLPDNAALLPVEVAELSQASIVQVACGEFFTAAVAVVPDARLLYVWGACADGQCGEVATADFVTHPTRVQVLVGKEVRSVSCGSRQLCAMVATHWIRDDEATKCMLCGVGFTVMNRRHHCRNCGGIFCNRCTSRRIPLLHLGHIVPVRVCDTCFSKNSADVS